MWDGDEVDGGWTVIIEPREDVEGVEDGVLLEEGGDSLILAECYFWLRPQERIG